MNKLIIRPKEKIKEKKPDGYRTFSIRIREETVGKLDEIAKKTGRSRNELIGMFLEFAADNCITES